MGDSGNLREKFLFYLRANKELVKQVTSLSKKLHDINSRLEGQKAKNWVVTYKVINFRGVVVATKKAVALDYLNDKDATEAVLNYAKLKLTSGYTVEIINTQPYLNKVIVI